MPNENKCVLPTRCEPEDMPEKEVYPPATPEFEICAGNYTLKWDGTRMTTSRRPDAIPDGTYGTVTFLDGCIAGVGECEQPTYSPPFCNPDPVPCGDSNGGSVTISTATGNTLSSTPLGLYAKTYVKAGNGASVTGTGVANDPYKISLSSSGGGETTVIAGDSSITVSTTDGVAEVSLADQGIEPGRYGKFLISSKGVITAIDETLTEDAVTQVTGGDGIDADTLSGGIVNVSLEKSDAGNKSYIFGDQKVTLSAGGVITKVAPADDNAPVKPILASYQVALVRDPELGDITRVHEWGDPVSYSVRDSGGNRIVTLPLPAWVSTGDYEVLINPTETYSYLNVSMENNIVTVEEAYDGGDYAEFFVNIAIREV